MRDLAAKLRFLRRRLDVLGQKICGVPEVLAHWQAQDPEMVAEIERRGPSLSVEEREQLLLDRHWAAAERSWRGVVDSVTEPVGEWEDEDDDPLSTIRRTTDARREGDAVSPQSATRGNQVHCSPDRRAALSTSVWLGSLIFCVLMQCRSSVLLMADDGHALFQPATHLFQPGTRSPRSWILQTATRFTGAALRSFC